MTLDDFIDSRWEWSPPGSVHSQYPKDDKYVHRESYRHRTKFVTLNSMPREHIREMFSRPPAIHAWASTKYEWGKERAIYGVDLTSATVAHFAMFNCEEALKHRFPVGEDAEAGRVHKRLKAMLEGCDSYCYDFDDFNAQHSTSSMVAVIKAYRDSFQFEMSEEQRSAMDWILNSYTDILIHAGDGKNYRPAGTLLSGSRLTTFINTVLNYVYMDIAGVFTHSGVVDSVHNGDDVLIAIKNVRAAIDTHDAMSEINARAQATKCNILSVGEFLRVEHKIDMVDGLGAQYLSRACATAVHSRIESQMPVRAVEAVSATVTRMKELARRAPASKDVILLLRDKIFKHLSEVFNIPYDRLAIVADAHTVVGGCSEDRWAPVEFKIREVIPHQPEELDDGETVESAVRPGCFDYATRLHKRLNGVVSFNTIHKSVSRATRAQLAITRETRLHIDDVSAQVKYKYARALKGMYKGIVKLPFIARARFLGVPPLALASPAQVNKLLKLTASVHDTMWALKVLL
uniref:RNA-directed RNA polymerase n=1 Tax=Uromyces fabae virus TaxID=3069272 RepID=A0AA51UAH8_9VIRU|nr:putative RNA-dependent RNA polymerase [Uromyces fabae virus]